VKLLEEDEVTKKLSHNEKQCIILRKGEKENLRFLVDTAEVFLKMCALTKKEAAKVALEHPGSGEWHHYYSAFKEILKD